MKKVIKAFTLSFLAIILLFSTTSAFAASGDEAVSINKQKEAKYLDAIDKLEEYVIRNNDATFELNVPQQVEESIDTTILTQIKAGMLGINELIDAGQLVSTENLSVYNPNDDSFKQQDGVNDVVFHWYGFDVYLSHSICWNITHAMNAVAAAATIVAAIPAATPVAAVIAGVLWLDATIIDWNDAGRGVVLFFLYPSEIYWMGGQ